MTAYLVSYDLNAPGANYTALIDAIKRYPGYCKVLASAWIVCSSTSAHDVSANLRKSLDNNDHIFVVDISGQQRQGWLPKDVWDWINKNV